MRVWLCASALLVFSIAVRVISPHPANTASANPIQTTPAQISTEEPATPDDFSETLRIGRGAILHAEWHPDGERVLAATVRGAWVYRLVEDRIVDEAHLEQARLGRFSPLGGYIAGVNNRNDVTLWNATDYSAVAVLPGHDAYVRAVAWRPGTDQLASLDRTGRILVWNANSRTLIAELQLDGADQIVWSPEGGYLAASDRESYITRAWRISSEEITVYAPPDDTQVSMDVVWRTDTQLLQRHFSESPTGTLWDIPTDTLTAVPFVGNGTAYSPDGTKLAAADWISTTVSNVETGETVFSVEWPKFLVVRWSPDSRFVAFGTLTFDPYAPGQIIVVDVNTGAVQSTFNSDFSIKEIAWAPDSQNLIFIDGVNQLHYFPGSVYPNIAHTEVGAAAAWRDDGRVIAVSDNFHGARLLDAETGEVIIPRMYSGTPTTHLSWQPGGHLLATAAGDRTQSVSNNVYVWDTSLSANRIADSVQIIPHADRVVDIGWSADGRTLATLETERYIRLFQPARPEIIRFIDVWAVRLAPFIDNSQRFYTLGWSPDGNWIDASFSSSGNPGGVRLLDVNAGALVAGDTPTNAGSTWTWTPDSRFIWARWDRLDRISPDQSIRVGGAGITDNGQQPLMLTGLTAPVADAVFSRDASRLIGFDINHNAIIWNVAAQRPVSAFSNVLDAFWSPDAELVAVHGTDGLIRIVDVQSGEAVYVFEQHWQRSENSQDDRWEIIWSPDGSRISLLGQGTLFIYDRVNRH